MPSFRAQLRMGLIAVVIGSIFGMIRLLLHLNTNDLWLAYGSAQLLLQGANPYDYPTNGWPSNPLPTVLVLAPFSSLSLEWVGVGMITVSTTLLIFGILRANEPWRLYTLLSLPFWYNLIFAQWGILFLAMLLLPELIWLSPVKPQLGLSVFLSRFRWRQALYAAAFLALSWLIYPGWPMLWLAQVGGYDGFIPILYLPIPILAIIIIRKLGVTSREVLFFLLFCCTPQRLWHDQLLLWAIPDRPRSALLLTIISWASIPATEMLSNLGMTIYWGTVLSIFVPSGLLLLAQGWHVPKTITKQALV